MFISKFRIQILHNITNSWIFSDIGRNSLLGNRKKIVKFLMKTFTCRSTFLYGPGTAASLLIWSLMPPPPAESGITCYLRTAPYSSKLYKDLRISDIDSAKRTYVLLRTYVYVLEIRLNVSVIERKTMFKLNYPQNGSGTCNRVWSIEFQLGSGIGLPGRVLFHYLLKSLWCLLLILKLIDLNSAGYYV